MPPVNVSNFIVPEVPTRESAGLVRLGETMQRNKEWDYRLRKDQEADQWRKLNLVQELTDLSKHQTGSDVANALGNKLMSDIYQKYTTNADKMSPIELQANIQKDMSGIITGMEGTKNELANLDKQAGALKTTYPGLDVGKLYKDAREDIIHRRLRNDLGGFNNEMDVQPSQFNLNDPEFLSNYVTDLKGLRTFVTSPQTGEKRQAFKGTRTDHTEFNGNITPWLRENFDRSKLSGGMLSWKDPDPKLELKSSKVGDLNVVDEDVYKLFNDSFPLETKYLARQQFQDYDKFDARKKQLAERSALDSYLRTVDQNQYYPSQVKTPSASLLKFYSGGSGGAANKPIELRDIYKEVNDLANTNEEGKVLLPDLTPEAQSIILKYTNDLKGRGGDLKMNQDQVYVKKQPNGDLAIVETKNDKPITKIPYESLNLPANIGIKAKQEVLKKAHEQSAPKMVTVVLSDGRKGNIPEDQVETFLKENKGSTRQ